MLRRPWTFPVLLSVLALALLALAACADGAVEEAQLVSPSVTTAQAPVNRPAPRTVVQPPLP
ncbi:MAG: hypothetical protein VX498_09635, partial [Myxococcota bacterium]|nr:hypothetical protein [Myxococcota bacterium]